MNRGKREKSDFAFLSLSRYSCIFFTWNTKRNTISRINIQHWSRINCFDILSALLIFGCTFIPTSDVCRWNDFLKPKRIEKIGSRNAQETTNAFVCLMNESIVFSVATDMMNDYTSFCFRFSPLSNLTS